MIGDIFKAAASALNPFNIIKNVASTVANAAQQMIQAPFNAVASGIQGVGAALAAPLNPLAFMNQRM